MNAETFCEQFATFAEAPNGVAKLRELILQLAVQGKLGTQDVNDEPASVLRRDDQRREGEAPAEPRTAKRLQSSIAARQELRPPDPNDFEDVPFTVPTGWSWCLVSDVFDVSGGITKNPKRTPVKNHYPYLRVANVQRGRLKLEEIERFELCDGELERWRLKPGDVLVVEGNGSEDEIGRCALWNGEIADCVHQNHIIRCRPLLHDVQNFALLFLNSPAGIAEMKERAITTSGLYSLSVGKIRSLVIPIPPFAEQRRIVGKVDQLLGLCDELAARQAARREARERLVGATLDRLVSATDHTSRHRACPGGSTASALLGRTADSTSAKAVEPLGQAQGRRLQEEHAHRLRDHFDRLFDTPTILPQLRQAILQLAVQGQLVPQDPNDEPVEKFLQANDQERLRRLESGTIRTKTSNDADTVKQSLDEVPDGWERRPLIELSQFIDYRGKTPTRTPAGVRLITAKNVRMGSVENDPVEFVTEKQYEQWMTRGFPEIGDLLLVTEGHTMGFVGMLDLPFRFALAQRTINLQPFVKGFNKYLLYYLMSPRFQSDVVRNSTGSAAKGIKASKLKQLLIAVPPLSEQKRIVSKVTELLSLCDALEAKLTQAESASTQLLSAAVAHLLQKDSREGAKPRRETAG